MADLPDWPYWKVTSITGQSGAGTDYQVELTIGDSAGGDFHLEGHCTNFPQDIRITDDDGTTLLDHWVEDLTADPIVVHVKVDDDLGSNQDIRVYYGKSGETTASNGDDAFPDLYNSFETDSDGYSAGVRSTIQSYVGDYSYKMTNDAIVESTPTLAMPLVLTNHVYMDSQSGQYSYVSNIFLNAANKWVRVYAGHPTASNWGYYSNGAWVNSGIAYSTGQWNKIEYTFETTTWSVSINGVAIATDVAYTSSSTTNSLGHKGVGGGTGISYLDCEYVRKYNSPEPAFSSAGAEQTPPAVGAIMNQFQGVNLGADLYNGVFA